MQRFCFRDGIPEHRRARARRASGARSALDKWVFYVLLMQPIPVGGSWLFVFLGARRQGLAMPLNKRKRSVYGAVSGVFGAISHERCGGRVQVSRVPPGGERRRKRICLPDLAPQAQSVRVTGDFNFWNEEDLRCSRSAAACGRRFRNSRRQVSAISSASRRKTAGRSIRRTPMETAAGAAGYGEYH